MGHTSVCIITRTIWSKLCWMSVINSISLRKLPSESWVLNLGVQILVWNSNHWNTLAFMGWLLFIKVWLNHKSHGESSHLVFDAGPGPSESPPQKPKQPWKESSPSAYWQKLNARTSSLISLWLPSNGQWEHLLLKLHSFILPFWTLSPYCLLFFRFQIFLQTSDCRKICLGC